MSEQRKPKWMTAWRYFVADFCAPTLGLGSLADQLLFRRDGFNLGAAAVSLAMTAGGPALARLIDSVTGKE